MSDNIKIVQELGETPGSRTVEDQLAALREAQTFLSRGVVGKLTDQIIVVRPSGSAPPARGIRGNDEDGSPRQGVVLAVKPGHRNGVKDDVIPSEVKVGDIVVYSKYGGTEITDGGEDLLILNGRDVVSKVTT